MPTGVAEAEEGDLLLPVHDCLSHSSCRVLSKISSSNCAFSYPSSSHIAGNTRNVVVAAAATTTTARHSSIRRNQNMLAAPPESSLEAIGNPSFTRNESTAEQCAYTVREAVAITQPLGVVIFGLGVVGGGVAPLLSQDKRFKLIGAFCRDPRKRRPGVPELWMANDIRQLIEHPETQLVVELMGGMDVAWDVIRHAICCDRHVVTANKAVIAVHMDEIIHLLEEHPTVLFRYEASVGGGVAMVDALRCGNKKVPVSGLQGVLNGTCNFILSCMEGREYNHGTPMSLESAVMEAQRQGFAEADPSADIDGHDTAAKLCILSKLAFGLTICPAQVTTVGIRHVRQEDAMLANLLGYGIRLMAVAYREPALGRIRAFVEPCWVKEPFSELRGCGNALAIKGTGIVVNGLGAGRVPTAAAVYSDLLDIAATLNGESAGVASYDLPAGSECARCVRPEDRNLPAFPKPALVATTLETMDVAKPRVVCVCEQAQAQAVRLEFPAVGMLGCGEVIALEFSGTDAMVRAVQEIAPGCRVYGLIQ